ncbi:MAG: hypothetical protein ACTSYX_03250 [Candidatus Thorarchaeota archaeon]
MKYYPYAVRLTSPAVLRTIGQDPSCATTLPYIPGSAVRGAVMRYLRSCGVEESIIERVVLGKGIAFLNAYPFVHQRRLLPTPKSYRMPKYGLRDIVFDLASAEPPLDQDTVRVGIPFSQIVVDHELLFTPPTGRRLHHLRDRRVGRSHGKDSKKVGTIYWNEFLESGQEFCGAIAIGEDEEEILPLIRDALSQPLLLGRAKRAGYGGWGHVTWESDVEREVLLTGHFGVAQEIEKGTKFRVVLLSDYIGIDAMTGEVNPHYVVREVLEALENKAELVDLFTSTHLVGGFNRRWGHQTMQYWVMSAGSILVLRATQDIDPDTIHRFESSGIGHQRVDGFGRVAVLDLGPPQIAVEEPAIQKPEKPPGKAPDTVADIVRKSSMIILSRRCRTVATTIADSIERPPSASLLGRLRLPLRTPDKALDTLKEWLDPDSMNRLKRTAMDKLEFTIFRYGDEELSRTLRDFLAETVRAGRRNTKERKKFKARIGWARVEEVCKKVGVSLDESEVPKLVILFLDTFLGVLSRKAARMT